MSANGFFPNHIGLLSNRRRHRDGCRLCSARAARVATPDRTRRKVGATGLWHALNRNHLLIQPMVTFEELNLAPPKKHILFMLANAVQAQDARSVILR